MNIDKSFGYWNLIDSTRVDDIAYCLFLSHHYSKYDNKYTKSIYNPPLQTWLFFGNKNSSNDNDIYRIYYKKANNILRKEKLIEILQIQEKVTDGVKQLKL